MSGQKARIVASPKTRSASMLPAQHRRYKRPSFFHMGPAALCMTCVLLVGCMAILYINQVGQVVAANHQLQVIHNEQAVLERQNQDLVDMLAQEQSPAYIIGQAQTMGLGPVDLKNLWILPVSHLQGIAQQDQPILA
jgi:hypothetical protein